MCISDESHPQHNGITSILLVSPHKNQGKDINIFKIEIFKFSLQLLYLRKEPDADQGKRRNRCLFRQKLVRDSKTQQGKQKETFFF